MFSLASMAAALAASIATTSAMPTSSQNWETVTNDLGYKTTHFKPGFEPGSADYDFRFGRAVNDSSLVPRQEDRTTFPYVGRNRIHYGCHTDVANTVFEKLYDICDDNRCDEGVNAEIKVVFPREGRRQEATLILSAEGHYPTGMRDTLIKGFQAMVPRDGVDYYEVESQGPMRAHMPQAIAVCEVVGASDYYSLVVRNNDDDALVADMDVKVRFETRTNELICGTVATVMKEIVGALTGIGGALFGSVQGISCE